MLEVLSLEALWKCDFVLVFLAPVLWKPLWRAFIIGLSTGPPNLPLHQRKFCPWIKGGVLFQIGHLPKDSVVPRTVLSGAKYHLGLCLFVNSLRPWSKRKPCTPQICRIRPIYPPVTLRRSWYIFLHRLQSLLLNKSFLGLPSYKSMFLRKESIAVFLVKEEGKRSMLGFYKRYLLHLKIFRK